MTRIPSFAEPTVDKIKIKTKKKGLYLHRMLDFFGLHLIS